jgi:hypothetical protein
MASKYLSSLSKDEYQKLTQKLYSIQNQKCFICEELIENQVSLMQAFRIAHPHCIYTPALPAKKVFDMFVSKKTVFMDNSEIDYMYDIIMRGL